MIMQIEPFSQPVYITQPLLPDIEDVKQKLAEIWESKQLTNNGKMARMLEKEMGGFLKADHLSLFSNGTVALQLALRVLRVSGEVITTPFTFAATTHVISLAGLKPVFCDIDDSYNIDPSKIERLITPETTAIMPVHVFGNPCKTEEIQKIAKKHGLKVIYDAAHAFGVEVDGKPVASFGDISMFSLHATKIYHTIEGGALAFHDPFLKERADSLRNFGIRGEDFVAEPGTNGKMNEVQAAVGLLLLKIVGEEIEGRKRVTRQYRELLKDVPGLATGKDMEGVRHNYPYFVVRVDREDFGKSRDELYNSLKEYNVISRRYFYPLCSQFQCYRDIPSASKENLPVAEKIVDQVLALPLHGRLTADEVERICGIIKHIRCN